MMMVRSRGTLHPRARSFRAVALGSAAVLAAALGLAGSPGGATAAPTPKPPKTVSFTSGPFETTEGYGSGCVTVQRSVTKGTSPSVTVSTTGGTATSGVDYTPTTTTVTFAKKAASADVCVPVLADQVPAESDETVTLTLSNVTGRDWTAGTPDSTTLTIHEMAAPTGTPSDLTAEVKSGSFAPYVHLTWTDDPAEHCAWGDGFQVRASTNSGGPYGYLADVAHSVEFDVTPPPSVDTYYVVYCQNAEGTLGPPSNEALGEAFVPGSGLYWADGSHGIVATANPDGSGAHPVVSGQSGMFGIAVDSSYLYWAATGDDAIMRSDLDGTNVITLVSDDADSHPYGVAVDASHVYWTDLQSQKVKRANLDGSAPETIIDGTGQLQPAAIAVDSTHLYLGDVAGNGRIMKAALDGSGLDTLVASDAYPFAIAVDGSHIYWAVSGPNEGAGGAIWRSALDGTGAATIATGQAHPTGIAVDSTHVYWANANNGTINRSGLDGSDLTTVVSGTNATAGVAVQR
jgi:sugar lactone lactonase YvrE